MKQAAFLVLSLIFLLSCSNHQPPVGVIDKDRMIRILTDIQLAEGALNRRLYRGENAFDLTKQYYDSLFATYGITQADFDSSLAYYGRNPALMEKIFDGVIVALHKLEIKHPDSIIDVR